MLLQLSLSQSCYFLIIMFCEF